MAAPTSFEVLPLAYKPHHVIAVLPGEQVVATPYETIRATSDTLRGSVLFRPTPRLELDHMTFEIDDMRITGDARLDGRRSARRSSPPARPPDGAPFAHDLAFNAENLALPAASPQALGRAACCRRRSAPVGLDATLAFDRPWDRASVEGDNPVLEGVEIRDLSLTWGKLDLRGRGTLAVDAEGFAEGRIDLRARNWEEMLDVAEAAGALDPTLAGAVRAGLGLLARLSGDGDALERAARLRRRRHPARPDRDRPGAGAGATVVAGRCARAGVVKYLKCSHIFLDVDQIFTLARRRAAAPTTETARSRRGLSRASSRTSSAMGPIVSQARARMP